MFPLLERYSLFELIATFFDPVPGQFTPLNIAFLILVKLRFSFGLLAGIPDDV